MTRKECDGFLIRIARLQVECGSREDRWNLAELAQRLITEYRTLYASILEHRLSVDEADHPRK